MASRVDAHRSGSHDQELLRTANIRDQYGPTEAKQSSNISGCQR
jgi:hypothetical protein